MTIDTEAATAHYIDGLGGDALAKAAAYTDGGHWLLLWGLAVTALVTWVIVRTGLLERVERRLRRRGPNLRAFVIAVVFLGVSALLSLPWTLYESWWREKSYGRTSQPLADFLGQGAIALLLSAVLGALFMTGVYALIRRSGRTWWIWSAGLTAIAMSALLLAAPIVIEPLFNEFKPVPAGPVRDAVAEIAERAGVPTDRIFVYDGSRQSNNFTANAAGLGGSARIAISDVAFKGASLDEVKAVTGHEVGHYVLGHVWRFVVMTAGFAVVFFFLVDRLFPVFMRAFGGQARLSDPVGLPVVLFMVSLFGFLAGPLVNALSRADEIEADRYSLETVNLPDALASALVKTAEYRNPRPTPLEEALFYDHPSVERRVRTAMEWKASHETH